MHASECGNNTLPMGLFPTEIASILVGDREVSDFKFLLLTSLEDDIGFNCRRTPPRLRHDRSVIVLHFD